MLNLPLTVIKTRKNEQGALEVFDIIRKKYIKLTPEENVRQQFIHYLISEKHFPASLISVEKSLYINNLLKRFDAVAYNNQGKPIVLIEFKAPGIKLKQSVFEQISIYNINLKVNYLIVSNGMTHYCCYVDHEKGEIKFMKDIPTYEEISFK